MSTIHDLRAWQSAAPRYVSDEAAAEAPKSDRAVSRRPSAEIILFPLASVKSVQRPRKKLARRRAAI